MAAAPNAPSPPHASRTHVCLIWASAPPSALRLPQGGNDGGGKFLTPSLFGRDSPQAQAEVSFGSARPAWPLQTAQTQEI